MKFDKKLVIYGKNYGNNESEFIYIPGCVLIYGEIFNGNYKEVRRPSELSSLTLAIRDGKVSRKKLTDSSWELKNLYVPSSSVNDYINVSFDNPFQEETRRHMLENIIILANSTLSSIDEALWIDVEESEWMDDDWSNNSQNEDDED